MGETYTALNDRCRRLIGDTSTIILTDLQIDEWINDAIRNISMHFPRVITTDLSTSDDVREYDLPLTFIAALSVEYPQGEDPPQYLERLAATDPKFWLNEGYYDILDTQTSDTNNYPQIIISEKPEDSETIRIIHTAMHTDLSDPGDETTVEDRHIHLIPLFVRWQCWIEHSLTDGEDPDPLKGISGVYETNAVKAEQAYYHTLNRALQSESHSAQSSAWKIDKHDRIY